MTRLFISHSTKDVDFVRHRLKPLFHGQGMVAWCSATDMRMAADWQRQVRAALAQADWFVVVLTPDAEQSEWVQAETHWALEHMRGRVIPLMVRTCDPAEVHLRLGTVQYVDFRQDPEAAGCRLLDIVLGGPVPVGCGSPVPKGSMADGDGTTVLSQGRQANVSFSVQPEVGPGYEQRIEIRQWAVIGRAEDADLRVLDGSVSRKHARIAIGRSGDELTLTLTDLDSANGTLVNQVPVLPSCSLAVGDVIVIGNARLHLLGIDQTRGRFGDDPIRSDAEGR